MMKTHRLFFAIRPPADILVEIQSIMIELDEPNLRLYRPQNLHQTLLFMGQIDEASLAALLKGANEIQVPTFEIQFDKLAFWPTPRILCLSCSLMPEALLNLVEQLNRLASELVVNLDKRPYHAHITLARKANSQPHVTIQPLSFQVTEFMLMKSILGSDGPDYLPLDSWQLSRQ